MRGRRDPCVGLVPVTDMSEAASCCTFLAVMALGAAARADGTMDSWVQAPDVIRPQRGSIAGSLAQFALGPADLARGVLGVKSEIAAPEDRGPLLADIFPSYSPEEGLGEWGMGWKAGLSIVRFRLAGDIDYVNDEYRSPWGLLVRGTDGLWYPSALRPWVRLQYVEGEWRAETAAGLTYVFSAQVVSERGIYAWYLTEVRDVRDRRTIIEYQRNSTGRPYVQRVYYGGVGTRWQYQVDFVYEATSVTEDYLAGSRLTHDRRITEVTFSSLHPQTHGMEMRWRYSLTYKDAATGPAFFLVGVQRAYAAGGTEPATVYDYAWPEEALSQAEPRIVDALDAYLALPPNEGASIRPHKVTYVDIDADGRVDMEHHFAKTLVRHTDGGWVHEPLSRDGGEHPRCRPTHDSDIHKPRHLVRLRPGDSEHRVLSTASGPEGTTFLVCDRQGHLLHSTQPFDGEWEDRTNVKVVDLNRDHRPDVIRTFTGGYRVAENVSDAANFRFVLRDRGSLQPRFAPTASWVHDFNGDGIPDLLSRYPGGVVVWTGLGALRFVEQGISYSFWSRSGVRLSDLDRFEFVFVDANKDGLTDVLLSQRHNTHLFVNTGKVFREVAVPGLDRIDGAFSGAVVQDLVGSGNTEVAFMTGQHVYSVALDQPGTGLLRRVDDGKGSILRLSYDRAPAWPGIYNRQPVVGRIEVETSGEDGVAFDVAYEDPQVHSDALFLLGFDGIIKAAPVVTEQFRFYNDNHVSGLLLSTTTTDLRTPSLYRFQIAAYDDEFFQGVPWKRLRQEDSGWATLDGAQVTGQRRELAAYDVNFCPGEIRVVDDSGTLSRHRTFADVPALGDLPHCLVAEEVVSGSHVDATMDFSTLTRFKRNEVGQVTDVTTYDDASDLVQQTIAYDGQYRVSRVGSPASGDVVAEYDEGTGLLAAVTTPEGVKTSVVNRHATTDGILSIAVERDGAVHLASYRYDAMERLEKRWDSRRGGSEEAGVAPS